MGQNLVVWLWLMANLFQGFASGSIISRAIEDQHDIDVFEPDESVNILLSHDQTPVLTSLKLLRKENEQLRQGLQDLQEDNSLLKSQLNNTQARNVEMINDLDRKLQKSLQETMLRVHMQVSEVKQSVEVVRRHQGGMEEPIFGNEFVLDVVKEFHDKINNVDSQLSTVQDRVTSLETDVSTLQVAARECPRLLTAVQQRLDSLTSKLQERQSSETPTTMPQTETTSTAHTQELPATTAPPQRISVLTEDGDFEESGPGSSEALTPHWISLLIDGGDIEDSGSGSSEAVVSDNPTTTTTTRPPRSQPTSLITDDEDLQEASDSGVSEELPGQENPDAQTSLPTAASGNQRTEQSTKAYFGRFRPYDRYPRFNPYRRDPFASHPRGGINPHYSWLQPDYPRW